MAYTIEDQLTRDIDWFVLDTNDKPIHVASAGGRIPDYIIKNDRLNKIILKNIRQTLEQQKIIINPNLDEIVNFESESMRFLYLRDFIFMAARGFYSYDKTVLGNFENTMYHLVAWPENQVVIDFKTHSLIPKLDIEFPVAFDSFNLINI